MFACLPYPIDSDGVLWACMVRFVGLNMFLGSLSDFIYMEISKYYLTFNG